MKLHTGKLRLGFSMSAAIAACVCISAALLGAEQQTSRADKYTARLEPALERICRDEKVPGLAVAVVEGGKLAYSHGFGLMKLGDPTRPVTADTLFHMASLKQANPARMAEGHTRAKDGTVEQIKHYPYNRAHTPSSNLHSSANDMVRWLLANLNGGELSGRRILKQPTHASMWKPEAETGKKGLQVGLSWFLEDAKGERLVVHSGGDDGFLTYVCLCPARSLGFVIMTNCDHGPSARKILDTISSTVLERNQKN
jgi:CubicO group peptidase (beta-lactamase class C family)